MHRPLSAAVAAFGLALGSVLFGALPAVADGSSPGPNTPVAAYSFTPSHVTVDATPGTGSHAVIISLFRVTDGVLVERCPDPAAADLSSPHAWGHHGPAHCTFGSLDPGAWRLLTQQDHQNDHWYAPSDLTVDDYIVIPPPPAIVTATLASDGSVAVTGAGVPGDRIHVFDAGGAGACDVTVDEAGNWGCGVAGPYVATATFTAIEENTLPRGEQVASVYRSGGLSAPSAAASVVSPAPVVVPQVVLDPNWTFTLHGIDLSHIRPGDTFAIAATGLPPGLDVSVELHSDPVMLATAKVGGDGSFSTTATIPLDILPGVHRIVVTLSGNGISPASKEAVVTIAAPVQPQVAGAVPVAGLAEAPQTVVRPGDATVRAPAVSVPPGVIEKPRATRVAPVAEPEAGEPSVEETESGLAPNILTEALQPIQHVLANPVTIASAISIGLVLIILAAIPAHLLNATIAEQYQRFSGRLARLRRPGWYTALSTWMAGKTVVAALALVTVTAVLFGFGDPHFGFNDHSLRLILACAIALFFVAFVSSWVTGLILKQTWSVTTEISLRPLGLVLTLLGVIASRLLEFSPGFLIGLVLGLSMATPAITQFAWRAVAIRSSIIIAFGVAAWIGYSALTVHEEPHDFLGALLVETFVAITTEGIVMLLIVLLPFKLLEGEPLFAHSKVLWGAIYLVVTVIFVVGVVAWEGHWVELGGALWLWISVVAVFSLVCVTIYLYFRFWAPPLPEETADEEEPLARVE